MQARKAISAGFLAISLGASASAGCDGGRDEGAGGGGGSSSGGGSSTGGSGEATLCVKYGGADVVASVVETNVIGAIASDCRINTFFTSLSEDAFTRVHDCLTIQVQELFGCPGVVYEGSEASNGLVCRSMADAHLGLGISAADFDALVEDVVAGLAEAGVETADIEAAAPALLGLKEDIVGSEEPEPTRSECEAGGAGGAGGD